MSFEKFGEDLFYHLSDFLSVIDLISLSHTCNFLHTNCKPLVYPKFKRTIIGRTFRSHRYAQSLDKQRLVDDLQNPDKTDIGIAGSFPLYVLLGNPVWQYNDIDVFHMKDTYHYGYRCEEFKAPPASGGYEFKNMWSQDFNLIFYRLDCGHINPVGIRENDTIVNTCFDRFDISVGKVVWSMNCLHIFNVEDIYNRTMHVKFSTCRSTRVDKYKERGFKISAKDIKRIEWREHKQNVLKVYRYKSVQVPISATDHILRSYGKGCRLYDNRFMYTMNNIKIPHLTDEFVKTLRYLFRNDIKSVKNGNIQKYCRHLLQFDDHNQVTVKNTIKILIHVLKFEISYRDKLDSFPAIEESDEEYDYGQTTTIRFTNDH